MIGLDVGGVNTKGARLGPGGEPPRTASRAFEIWRDRDALGRVLREVVAELGGEPGEPLALTMTAELSDAFRTKREGVGFVLDATVGALDGHPALVLTTGGELIEPAAARERPLEVAAANWVASAIAIAERHPDALVLDVGSTTADLIPLREGRIAAEGRTDVERLIAGELVYTGALRTNLAAIAPRVPLRGGWCPVASELFAISADVHLIRGAIAEADYACPTPDGREPTPAAARVRVARLVCADVEQLAGSEIDAIVDHLAAEQLRQLAAAARRALARTSPAAPVVPLGAGAFMAREVATGLGRELAAPPAGWGEAGARLAPALGLAEMLGSRC